MKLKIRFDAARAKAVLEESLALIDAMPEERRTTAVMELLGRIAEECIELHEVVEPLPEHQR